MIRYLEHRRRANRSHVRFPEHERHAAPIEVAFELAGTLFAMEHTGIEPFEGHTELQATAAMAVIRSPEPSKAGYLPLRTLNFICRRVRSRV